MDHMKMFFPFVCFQISFELAPLLALYFWDSEKNKQTFWSTFSGLLITLYVLVLLCPHSVSLISQGRCLRHPDWLPTYVAFLSFFQYGRPELYTVFQMQAYDRFLLEPYNVDRSIFLGISSTESAFFQRSHATSIFSWSHLRDPKVFLMWIEPQRPTHCLFCSVNICEQVKLQKRWTLSLHIHKIMHLANFSRLARLFDFPNQLQEQMKYVFFQWLKEFSKLGKFWPLSSSFSKHIWANQGST